MYVRSFFYISLCPLSHRIFLSFSHGNPLRVSPPSKKTVASKV